MPPSGSPGSSWSLWARSRAWRQCDGGPSLGRSQCPTHLVLRAADFGGRKPPKRNSEVGRPEATSAVTAAEGPGTETTRTPVQSGMGHGIGLPSSAGSSVLPTTAASRRAKGWQSTSSRGAGPEPSSAAGYRHRRALTLSDGGLDKVRPWVTDPRGAGVADQCHPCPSRQPTQQLGLALSAVVVVVGQQLGRPDRKVVQQLLGVPRVLGQQHVGCPQHAQRSERDVLQVADRGADEVQPCAFVDKYVCGLPGERISLGRPTPGSKGLPMAADSPERGPWESAQSTRWRRPRWRAGGHGLPPAAPAQYRPACFMIANLAISMSATM